MKFVTKTSYRYVASELTTATNPSTTKKLFSLRAEYAS